MSRRLVDGKRPVRKPDANKGGRPTKLEIDPDLVKRLRNAILLGAPILTAATLNGINYTTMRSWVIKAQEDPNSEYAALMNVLRKAIAEYEIRDLSAWDAHITGRPAQYVQQQVVNNIGEPQFDKDGKPIMEYVRDSDGNLILQAAEIKSDWRAAAERISRRLPRTWAPRLGLDLDPVLSFDNKEKEINPKEALSFEDRIAEAVRELEDEV